jgi:hypothetical protein
LVIISFLIQLLLRKPEIILSFYGEYTVLDTRLCTKTDAVIMGCSGIHSYVNSFHRWSNEPNR